MIHTTHTYAHVSSHMHIVGQDRIYICTVYDRIFGDYLAKNTVYTPYIYIYGSRQPYTCTINFSIPTLQAGWRWVPQTRAGGTQPSGTQHASTQTHNMQTHTLTHLRTVYNHTQTHRNTHTHARTNSDQAYLAR
jgi:hypothetical protein